MDRRTGAQPAADAGYFATGLPYNRFGSGPRPLVVFTGLGFENKPASGFEVRFSRGPFQVLEQTHTVWVVNRRPALAPGTSIADMGDDYAATIRSEFAPPVDVLGLSTGGSIALQFAIDHPELIRHLVIYSAASRLDGRGKRLQLKVGELAKRRHWGRAMDLILGELFLPKRGIKAILAAPAHGMFWLLGWATIRPKHPDDVVITIQAEDAFDIGARLGEIRVPTLVVAGAKDPFYRPALFESTAAGIPGARLHLEPTGGHVPTTEGVRAAISAFLGDDAVSAPPDAAAARTSDGAALPLRTPPGSNPGEG